MAKKKNNTVNQVHHHSFLSGVTMELHPEGNLKDTALSTVRDLVVGVVVGGAAGAAIGKPSLLVGAAITGFGHYKKMPLATLVGIGMMASNGFQNLGSSTVKGVEKDVVDGIKDRLMAYKESFQEKLYLDKIMKKKEPINGMGKVQYFTYPNDENMNGNNAIDMSELDRIEQHLTQSANDFANKNQMKGLEGAADWMETGSY